MWKSDSISKEMEIIKSNQTGIIKEKNIMTKMKWSLERVNSRFEQAEDRINKTDDRTIESIQWREPKIE
jgi:hypothetical protein